MFFIGRTFTSTEEVKDVLKTYNSDNSSSLVITTNNKKSVIIKCSHGISRKSKSTGKRPHQHYNYIGCDALVSMYKNKDGVSKITNIKLQHNHKGSLSNSSPSLTPDEENLVIDLRNANAQTSQIKRVIREIPENVCHTKVEKLNTEAGSPWCVKQGNI